MCLPTVGTRLFVPGHSERHLTSRSVFKSCVRRTMREPVWRGMCSPLGVTPDLRRFLSRCMATAYNDLLLNEGVCVKCRTQRQIPGEAMRWKRYMRPLAHFIDIARSIGLLW